MQCPQCCVHDAPGIPLLVQASLYSFLKPTYLADPDNWAIQSWEFDWVNANVIRDRAAIVHAQNKPFIIEETGMKVLSTTCSICPTGSYRWQDIHCHDSADAALGQHVLVRLSPPHAEGLPVQP